MFFPLPYLRGFLHNVAEQMEPELLQNQYHHFFSFSFRYVTYTDHGIFSDFPPKFHVLF